MTVTVRSAALMLLAVLASVLVLQYAQAMLYSGFRMHHVVMQRWP